MKDSLRCLFLKIYAAQGGVINRWLTGAVVGGVVAGLTKLMKEAPSAELVATITTIATLAVTTLIADFVTKAQANNAEKAQVAINKVKSNLVPTVKEDGRIGEKTIEALHDMADSVNVMASDMTKAEIKEVKTEIINMQPK